MNEFNIQQGENHQDYDPLPDSDRYDEIITSFELSFPELKNQLSFAISNIIDNIIRAQVLVDNITPEILYERIVQAFDVTIHDIREGNYQALEETNPELKTLIEKILAVSITPMDIVKLVREEASTQTRLLKRDNTLRFAIDDYYAKKIDNSIDDNLQTKQ